MDDGSTDNTESLVKSFQEENIFPIEYYKQKNQHKFLTVLDGKMEERTSELQSPDNLVCRLLLEKKK